MSAEEERLIGHSYTRARKHPLVIGKLPGAGRLPGGPYTITQVVAMVAAFLLLVITRQIWAHFGALDALAMVIVPWGLAWALRYARLDGRDPARALRSLLVYASIPADGRLGGRPQHDRKLRLAEGVCTVHVRAASPASVKVRAEAAVREPMPAPFPVRPAATTPAAAARPAARSGLQDLLASLDER